VLNLLRGTLLAVLLVSLFAIPFYLDTYAHSLPDWELIGIGLTVVLIVILGVLSFARGVPYVMRACGVLLMPSMFYIYGLFYTGAEGETLILMMACVVLAFMLFGKRGGAIVWMVAVLLFAGVGWGMVTQNLTEWHMIDHGYQASFWVYMGVETLFLAGMLIVGVLTLQDAFSTAHHREREAFNEVFHERALLEVHVAERTQELRDSNLKLEQAYQQLQANQEALLVSEKMASLGRLTAGIADEMNTPLAAVQASLFELEKLVGEYRQSINNRAAGEEDHHEIAREMSQAVDISEHSISRALSYIRSVKSQTRQMDGDQRQRFDVGQVIEEALLLLDHELIRANCQMVFKRQEKNLELIGIAPSFAQVVTNLVTNAIDASHANRGGLITVALSEEEESLRLQVSDEGVGIPEEIRAKIFDPLFTTKPFGEATGLGLTLVHDIVTKGFHGSIDVTSQVGEGTMFTLCFPNLIEGVT